MFIFSFLVNTGCTGGSMQADNSLRTQNAVGIKLCQAPAQSLTTIASHNQDKLKAEAKIAGAHRLRGLNLLTNPIALLTLRDVHVLHITFIG
jgi:hypothetical protein